MGKVKDTTKIWHTKVIRQIPVLTSHILIDLSREADTKYGPGFPPLLAPYNQENQTKSARDLYSGSTQVLSTSAFCSNLPGAHTYTVKFNIYIFSFNQKIPNHQCNFQLGNWHLTEHHTHRWKLLLIFKTVTGNEQFKMAGDNKGLKGKSKGNGFQFKIMEN